MKKVTIQKVIKDENGNFVSTGKTLEGWEKQRPAVNKPYVVLHRGVFKTSAVSEIQDDLIFTRNSVYKVTIIGEYQDSSEELDSSTTQNILILGIGR
jgi:hypothetical protein